MQYACHLGLELYKEWFWTQKYHLLYMSAMSTNLKNYSGIFYFCQYLHIGAGILSLGGDVLRL